MKCTNKRIASFLLALILCTWVLTSCGPEGTPNDYRVYDTSYNVGITRAAPMENTVLLSDHTIVAPQGSYNMDNVEEATANLNSCAVFNTSNESTVLCRDAYKQVYPASTTKILTAYIALTEGNLDEVYTASEYACDQESDSSVAGLVTGDRMSLNDLLYGLMLVSGNDAAIVIAEGMCGSTEAFADKMNETCKKLGATQSHFVTVNGLPDDEHYTSAYDMYLIFREACKNETFRKILSTVEYTTSYTGAAGNGKVKTWHTTNRYINGKIKMPDGITVLGGKTGTTGEAGFCLVALAQNEREEELIGLVFGAESRWELYNSMSRILEQGNN